MQNKHIHLEITQLQKERQTHFAGAQIDENCKKITK